MLAQFAPRSLDWLARWLLGVSYFILPWVSVAIPDESAIKHNSMKYHWEEKDVVCGRIICKPLAKGQTVFKADGWTAKWTLKIGYNPAHSSKQQYCLISMTDGFVGACQSKATLVKYLNREQMRPMPHDWWLKTVEFLRDCYETNQ